MLLEANGVKANGVRPIDEANYSNWECAGVECAGVNLSIKYQLNINKASMNPRPKGAYYS
jgi:hypothetical protein